MNLTTHNLPLPVIPLSPGFSPGLSDSLRKSQHSVTYITFNFSSAGTALPTSREEESQPAFMKYFEDGMRRSNEGDWQGAATAFTRAVELRPNFYPANFNLGVAYGNLINDELAYKSFRKAVDLHGDDPLAHYYLGLAAAMLGKVDASLTSLREAERLGLELTAERAKDLAWAYFTNGFNLMEEAGRERQARQSVATFLWRKAEKVFGRAIELRHSFAEAYFLLGKAYSNLAFTNPESSPEIEGLIDRAFNAYGQVVGDDPILASWAYTEMGMLWSRRGDLGKALELFGRAVETYPENTQALYNRGLVRLTEGQYKGAVEDMLLMTAAAPENASAYHWLGLAYASLEKYTEAETALRRALELNPQDTDARINLGVTAYKQGRPEEAEALFREVLKISPGHENAARMLAEMTEGGAEPGGLQSPTLTGNGTEVLRSLYHLEEPDLITEFVQQNSFLIELLVEAPRRINSVFGEETKLALQLSQDPEDVDSRELFINILTTLSAQEAFPLLERLDEEWWLDISDRADGKLNIRLRYV
jgi:tetratricopeptide (TPR) repeat protein